MSKGIQARISARVIAAIAGSQRLDVQMSKTSSRWEPEFAAISGATCVFGAATPLSPPSIMATLLRAPYMLIRIYTLGTVLLQRDWVSTWVLHGF